MALVNWKGIQISRNCLSRMHDQCRDIGCDCACGCNVGMPMSNMSNRNARRSGECVNGNHMACNKASGAPCPCACHEKNYSGNRSWFCMAGQHNNCKIRFGSCACTAGNCDHNVGTGLVPNSTQTINVPIFNQVVTQYSPPNISDVVMPLTTGKANYKDAVLRLAPIAEQVKEQMMLNRKELSFCFVGETVRDALYRGLVDSYKIEFHYSVGEPATTFITEHFKKFIQVDGSYKLATKYGDIKIELADEDELSFWNCDWYTYDLDRGIVKKSTKVSLLETNNALALVDNGGKIIPNAKVVLEQGANLALKYGWNIDNESIERLTKSIEADKPLENTHELVIGFRSYNLEPGYAYGAHVFKLKGSHGAIWETKELSVDCPDFKEHIKAVGEDWRGRGAGSANTGGNHDCGIYVYKDPSECLFHYGMTQKTDAKNTAIAIVYCWGVIGEFEIGYRVEHCEIQRLWIWDENKRLAGNYDIDEVYSGLPFSHFLYDAEVKQVADMNQLKKGSY